MPSVSNWGYFIYVNLAFLFIILLIFYYSSMDEIKKNWNDYRCNPMYMPLSDNIEQDFQYCIQNTQINFMGYILQPLTYITSNLTQNTANYNTQINDIRGMFDKVRTFMSDTIQSVFGVFLNLIIEFQKITISIKDLMGKTIGILVTVMYIMDGSIKTMNSTWNGPPGQMVKSLGKCFHPNTLILLDNGTYKYIKDIKAGDVIYNNGYKDKVLAVLKFPNNPLDDDYEVLYELDDSTYRITRNICKMRNQYFDYLNSLISNKSNNGIKIYITGNHYIYDDINNKYVKIKNYSYAKRQTEVKTDVLYCLITDTHLIHINDFTFLDYNDNLSDFV